MFTAALFCSCYLVAKSHPTLYDPMDCSILGSSVLHYLLELAWGFPGGSMVKNLPASAEGGGFNPWVGKIPWRRKWIPTSAFFPGKSLGQKSLKSYSLLGYKRVRHDLVIKQQQAALLPYQKIWEQLKCPLRGEWIKKMYMQSSLGIHRLQDPLQIPKSKDAQIPYIR